MKLQWRDIKSKKKLIFVFMISISIQIIIFLITQISNWISQKPNNEPWFIFLTQTIEPYSDYKVWYQTFARQTLYEDWLPYIKILNIYVPDENWYNFWFIDNEELFLNFIYPPFFFYILILPSFINVELVFLPLFLANAFIPIVIYNFLIKRYEKKVAEWGFIATALNPLYIFYNGGLALNSSLITLFFVLSLYFISINRFSLSIIFLSISILIKQIVIFFVPPIMIYLVLKSFNDKREVSLFHYLKKFIEYFGILIIILFIGSLPWILITPGNYLRSVLLAGVQLPTFLPPFYFPYPHYNSPIFWYDFLYSLKAPYLLFWFFGFLNFTYIGIVSLEIVVISMLIYWFNKNILNWVKFFDMTIYTIFLTYLFFPRGLYKYYFSFLVPLIVLWICFHFGNNLSNNNSKGTNWMLIIISISILFMLIPRIYYLIIIWVIFFYILKKNNNLTNKMLGSTSIIK